MHCPNCGTENTEQADFCTHCAEPLKTGNAQTIQSEVDAGTQQENTATRKTSEPIETNTTKASREESSDASMRDETVSQPRPRITNLDFQSEKQASEKPVVSPGMFIAIILLSIPIPPIGIAMGYTYLRKSHPDAKKAGKIWLIWGIITFAILALLAIT